MKQAGLWIILAACLATSAQAQQSTQPQLEKPAAPAKPVAPTIKTTPEPSAKSAATPSSKPSAALPFASELQSLSPQARAFATSKLAAMTPSLRVQAATRVTGKAVSLSQIPETWLAGADNPAGARLWLGAKSANLLTGPDLEAMFQVGGGDGVDRGVWVQFNATAGMRYLLICDMTNPARWDVVVDTRTRAPMTAENDTRGEALIAARSTSGYLRVLLTLARPLQTGPGASISEGLRRCEVTPIRN